MCDRYQTGDSKAKKQLWILDFGFGALVEMQPSPH